MFTVDESTTDYQVTFVEHLPINIRKATNHTFRVTQNSVMFEIKIYLSSIEAKNKGYAWISIQLITSQQATVELIVCLDIEASGISFWNDMLFPTLLVNDSLVYNLDILDNIMNETLEDGGNFTITMIGSYLNHTQHAIATSHTNFNAKTHSSVNMSYTWTVCNLALPLVSNEHIVSKIIFAGLGVAEFNIRIRPGTEFKNFVSFFSQLKNTSNNIKLPLRIRHTFELIDSNSPEHAVIDQLSMTDEYEHMNEEWGTSLYFKYDDLVKSMQHQCATIKYRVVYKQ